MSQSFRKSAPETRVIKSFPVPQITESHLVEGQRHFISHTDSLGVVKIMLWFPHGISVQKSSSIATAAYELDDKAMTFTIYYNSKKTTLQAIKKGISKLGYDADEVKADPKAYESLDGCCKA